MERLLGLAINDASLTSKVVSHHRGIFDLARNLSDGGWGLGVHRHGEMLVQKRRISADIDSAKELIKANARHAVMHVAPRRPGPFELDHVQPYRYRNWLFASVGALAIDGSFVEAVSEKLRGFTAQGRWMACPAEGAMLLYMKAFHHVGELDRTRAHTRVLREAIRGASEQLLRLASQGASPNLALVLHVRGYSFVLSLGRRVGLKFLRLEHPQEGLLKPAERHVRALAYQSDPDDGFGELLPEWSMVEIDPQAAITSLSLG